MTSFSSTIKNTPSIALHENTNERTEEQDTKLLKNIYNFNYAGLFQSETIQDIYDRWAFGPEKENKDKLVIKNIRATQEKLNNLKPKSNSFDHIIEDQKTILKAFEHIAALKTSTMFREGNLFHSITGAVFIGSGLSNLYKSLSDIKNGHVFYGAIFSAIGLLLLTKASFDRREADNILKSKNFIFTLSAKEQLIASDFSKKPQNISLAYNPTNNRSNFVKIDYLSDLFASTIKNIQDRQPDILTEEEKFHFKPVTFKADVKELTSHQKDIYQLLFPQDNATFIQSSTIQNSEVDKEIQELFTAQNFTKKFFKYTLNGKEYKVLVFNNPKKLSLDPGYKYLLGSFKTASDFYLHESQKRFFIDKETKTISTNNDYAFHDVKVRSHKDVQSHKYGIIIDQKAPDELVDHLKSFLPKDAFSFFINKAIVENGNSHILVVPGSSYRRHVSNNTYIDYSQTIAVNSFSLYKNLSPKGKKS